MIVAASLLAIAVVASLAVWEMRPKAPAGRSSSDRSDYILENFELTSLDEDGSESFTLKAPHLERDPGGKTLSITEPEFSFPDKKEGRWLVTSNSAWVGEKGAEVRLTDQVEMLGPPSPLGDRTRFSTAHLQIFPKQNLALSDDAVTISRADSILHGTGLRADMQSHHIQLLANVKGRYAPARP